MKLKNFKKAMVIVDVLVIIALMIIMLSTNSVTQMFSLVKAEKVNAGAENMSFNLTVTPEETKTKAGKTVTLILSVADIDAGENGINSIVGFLEYDEALFESVDVQGIITGTEGYNTTTDWNIELNKIQGHELYGKFCIYTIQESVTENQDVVKITMKLKSDLAPQITEVNFTDLVSSDGDFEITDEDRTAVIIIETEEDDDNQSSEGDGNQGTEGDGNQGSEGDGNQGTEGDGSQGSEGDGNQGVEGDGSQGSEGDGNQGAEGDGNQGSQGNQGNQAIQKPSSPQTGDTKILIVLAILILVIIANLLIFCKKSKTKIIATFVTIIVGILSFIIVSNAQNIQNNTQPLTINDKINNISFQEKILNTDKVLVKDSTISAVTPEMIVEDFLNIFNSQIKVTNNGTQVTSGELKTGMKVSLLNPTSTDIDKDTIYEVVVAGDINKDGISNQIELTKIIRNTINNQKWQLKDIEKLAADMNIDGKIDNKDVEASVNYIVYGDSFEYTETVQEDIRNVDAPIIEVVQGDFNEEVNCYINNVIIRITETDKNASKTRYKIEDENGNFVTLDELANNSSGNNSSTQYTGLAKFVEMERTNKDENGNVIKQIIIKKDGIYKISALTDGELGNRSDITYKVIVKGKSDKKYTVTYDYATNGGASSADSQITTENIDVTYNTPVDLSKQGTKQYYKFIGWNTDATATTALSTFTMGIQNETLYAIYEKDIKIELEPTSISIEYGSTQTITATTKNTGNIIWTSSDDSVATVSDTGVVTAKKVGTVTITATASTDSTVTATCQVTVTPKTLTISASADNKEYDGTTNVVNGQILVNGILNTDDVSITADFAYEDANVGTDKKVNVTNITLSGADANNYKINETTLTTTSSILAKSANNQDIQASLDNIQVTYNGKEQKPTVTITDNLTTLIEGIDYDVEYKDNKNAGTATVKVTLKGNYSGTKELTFEIQKAILTATYAGEAIEYGQTPQLKVTVDGFVNNETADTAEEYVAPIVTATSLQQGTYTLTPQGGSAKNYYFNYVSGLLIINAKLDVDIQLAETQFIYDGTAKEPAVIVKDGNTVLVEGTDYDVVYADNINAGTGTATVTLKGNYTGTAVKTFTIDQAQGTGSLSIEGWTYGENAKTPVANSNTNTQVTYQYTGTTNAGVSYSNSVAPTQAGNYTLTATFAANNNFKGFSQTADFVVAKAELIPTATANDKVYDGNTNATGTIMLTGAVNNENPTIATSTFAFENAAAGINKIVNVTNIKLEDVWESNYKLTETDITTTASILSKDLTENEITVSLSETEFTYDGTAKEPTVTIKDGEKTLTQGTDYTVTYTDNVNAGTATIIIDGAGNYSTQIIKTFIINKVKLTPSATVNSKVYDGTTTATGTITLSAAVNNENPIVSVLSIFTFDNATAGTNKTVTVSNIELEEVWKINYELTQDTLILTNGEITKAELTATYLGENITYGETPVLDIHVDGFVNGEDETTAAGYKAPTVVITDKDGNEVTVQDLAVSGSPYTVTPKDGDATNYKFKYEDGVLVVNENPAIVEITLTPDSFVYDGTAKQPAITVTDIATGKVLTANTDYTFGYVDNINAGTGIVNITLIGNYTGIATETFEILQADGIASVTIEGWIYGEPSNNPVPYSVTNGTDSVTYLYTGTTNAGVVYSDSVAPTEAGNYKVTATFAQTQNYKEVKAEDDFTISKAQVAEPAVNTGLVYTGALQEGVTSGSNYVLTGDAKATNAGNYTAIATLSNTNNYEWADGTTEPKKYNWSIAKVQLTPSAIANNKVYDGTTIATGTMTFAEAVNNEQPTATVNFAFENETVGEDKIVNVTDIVLDPEWTTNYQLRVAQTQTIADITAAKLTATYVSEEINYGEKPELKVEVTGFVNGETEETATRFTIPVVENTNTEPGEYELTPEGGTATNYTFEYVKGTLKINLPTFTITYELNDGELEDGKENPNEYTQKSEDITLNNPTKSGYEFLGWTLTKLDGVAQDSSTPSTTVTIAKGSKGNRVYTANWNLVAPTVEVTSENLEVNLFEDETTTFTATVKNASNPTYQWYYGENAIEGATASTYSISTTDMNSNNYKGGEYSVAVTNNEPVVTLAETEANTTTAISEKLTQTVKYDEVASATQMSNFATRVNKQAITFEGDNITQTADVIDLSTVCSASTKNWTPIGTTTNTFKGTFDGNNKKVTNLYIEQKTVVQDELYMLGLFGVTSGSTIKNITVSGNITGIGTTWHTVVGGIVARNINGTIDNCTNNVNIVAISRAGGIAGKSEENSVITNCINNGTITSDVTKTIEETTDGVTKTVVASRWIGGIAGVGQGVISNCTNTANIVGNRAGGISGISNNGQTSILNCINNGNLTGNQNGGITYTFKGTTDNYKISNCVNTGDLIVIDTYNETNLYGAGIANTNDGLIERCYNTGNIDVISENYNTASIVGGIFAADGKGSIVRKCYNEGNIIAECNHDGDSTHAMCSAGGIAGYIRRNTFIEDCYNRGNITADKLQGGNTNSAGGIVGYISFTELNEVTPGELLPEGEVNTDVNEINSYMIKDCYSTGDINGTKNGGKSYVGGVLGQYNATSRDINEIVSNTYYLNTSTDTGIDLNGVNTTSIAISKESSEMKEDAFVTLLGDDTWKLVAGVNEDYPVFGWQYSTFNIEYDLAGGELLEGVTNPKNYVESSADIKLNNPVRTGYTFTGWTGTDLTGATIDVTIPSGSTGNREYVATWELAAPTVSVTVENPEVNLFDNVTTTFTANVENAANPTYQWYYNGTEIDGATASTYSIATTEMTESNYKGGEYTVAVTNNEAVATLAENEENLTTTVSEPKTQTTARTVGTAQQMKNFQIRVNEQEIVFENDTITQVADIDLSSICGETKGNWTPIGIYAEADTIALKGVYDGQNNEITNLYIDETFTGDRAGLFSVIWYGGVKNLTISGNITTGSTTITSGGITAQVTNAEISNCTNNVNIIGENSVGGIAGYAHANGLATIKNCVNNGSIIVNNYYAGGIIGKGQGTIQNCENNGTVTGKHIGGITGHTNSTTNISNCINNASLKGNTVGGIVYNLAEGASISDCKNLGKVSLYNVPAQTVGYLAGIAVANEGTIQRCYNSGEMNGTLEHEDSASIYMGGIVANNRATIEKCYNIGVMSAKNMNNNINVDSNGEKLGNIVHCGGIVGVSKAYSVVSNCYNRGNVTSYKVSGYNSVNAAGIVSQCQGATVISCYSTGEISASRDDGQIGIVNIGGIASYQENGYETADSTEATVPVNITNCYYLENSAPGGINEADVAGSAEVRTSDFMKTDDFVTLLGAENWQIVANKNDGYPVLNWQYATYTINFDLAGGELPDGVTNASNYEESSIDIKLNNPVRAGYVFTGWTGTDLTEVTLDVTIPSGSTGNREYTANWEEAKYYNETSDIYYLTLAEATDEAESGSTINVIKTANETVAPTVAKGKTVTLDMNGNTVSLNGVSLTNNGTLTITGESGTLTSTMQAIENTSSSILNKEGNCTITGTGAYSTIYNSGKLTLTKGEITSASYGGVYNQTTGQIIVDGGKIETPQVAINTWSNLNTDATPAVLVNGGEIKSINRNAITNYSATGLVYVKGGTISSTQIEDMPTIYNDKGLIKVSGGTITSEYDRAVCTYKEGGEIVITGGKLLGEIAVHNVEGSTLTIGSKADAVSTTTPEIIGSMYGVLNAGTFNFYDGVIKGVEDSICITGDNVIGLPDDYKVEYMSEQTTVEGQQVVYDVAYLTKIERYTVNYYNGTTLLDSSEHVIGGTEKLTTMSTLGGSKSGYTFSGWTTSTSATTATYADGASVSNLTTTPSGTVNLYAIWQRNVTFYSGTAKEKTESKVQYYNSKGGNYSVTAPSTIKEVSGWTASGWRADTTANASQIAKGSVSTSSAAAFYAVYTRDITFKSGPSGATVETAVQYYNSNDSRSSIKMLTPAVAGDWKTEGWRDDKTAGEASYSAGEIVTPINVTTYYAIYTRTVTFYSGEGNSSSETATQYYNSISAFSTKTPEKAKIEAIDGWTVLGWRNDLTAGGSEITPGNTTTMGDSKFYAVYSRNITFKSGINGVTSETVIQYHNCNGAHGSLDMLTPTEIANWECIGWRDDENARDKEYDLNGRYAPVAVTTYYAVYSRDAILKYNANGGTGTIADQKAAQYYNTTGAVSTPSFTLVNNTFTRAGYKFSKWAAANPAGTQYAEGETYTKFAPIFGSTNVTHTMYAIWESNGIVLTSDIGDIQKITSPNVYYVVSSGGAPEFNVKATVPANCTVTYSYDYGEAASGTGYSVESIHGNFSLKVDGKAIESWSGYTDEHGWINKTYTTTTECVVELTAKGALNNGSTGAAVGTSSIGFVSIVNNDTGETYTLTIAE